MKRIIYKTENGGVAVIIPAPEARQQVLVSEAVYTTVTVPATEETPEHDVQELVTPAVYRSQTDDEFINWIAEKDVPSGAEYAIVNTSDIPEDRTFRGAWTWAS